MAPKDERGLLGGRAPDSRNPKLLLLLPRCTPPSADINKSPSRRHLLSKLCQELPQTGDRPEFRGRQLAVGGRLFNILCVIFRVGKFPAKRVIALIVSRNKLYQ